MKKHIVIIEDDMDMRYIQTQLLENEGHKVTGFSAVSSLEELLSLNADCFILDEQMPLVSGHIICIYLRSKPQTANTPIILVSGHPKLNEYAGLSAANDWLEKPFSNKEFIDKVNSVIWAR